MGNERREFGSGNDAMGCGARLREGEGHRSSGAGQLALPTSRGGVGVTGTWPRMLLDGGCPVGVWPQADRAAGGGLGKGVRVWAWGGQGVRVVRASEWQPCRQAGARSHVSVLKVNGLGILGGGRRQLLLLAHKLQRWASSSQHHTHPSTYKNKRRTGYCTLGKAYAAVKNTCQAALHAAAPPPHALHTHGVMCSGGRQRHGAVAACGASRCLGGIPPCVLFMPSCWAPQPSAGSAAGQSQQPLVCRRWSRSGRASRAGTPPSC